MANTNFISAANLFGWGQSFNATGKFPLIAKRVWSTYDDMIAFVSDTSDVCPAGVVLTVINDTDSKKNGAYFVASCPTLENPDLPVDVQKIGSGETYYFESESDIPEDIPVGATYYLGSEAENPGFYYVNENKAGIRILDANDTGNFVTPDDIESLVADVTVNGTSVVTDGVAVIDLTEYAKTEDLGEYAKVSDLSGYVSVEDSNFKKMSTVEENANYVAKIVFNGENVVLDSQTHSFTLNTPADKIQGVVTKTGENETKQILSVDDNGLIDTTLELVYVHDEDNETPYQLQLVGSNGVISYVNAQDFVKDGMLESAALVKNPEGKGEGTYLVLTFNTAAGLTEPMYVAVTDLIDTYTGSNSIKVDGKTISAIVNPSDAYLEITDNGISTKGITAAITTAKNEVVGNSTDAAESITIYGARKYAESLVGGVTTTLSNYKVKNVNTDDELGYALTLDDSGIVGLTANIGNLKEYLTNIHDADYIVAGTTVKLGADITDGEETDPTTIISGENTIHSAIQTLAGQIQAAVAGGITGISGDNYITVGGTATTKSLTFNPSSLISTDSAIQLSDGKLTLVWEEV